MVVADTQTLLSLRNQKNNYTYAIPQGFWFWASGHTDSKNGACNDMSKCHDQVSFYDDEDTYVWPAQIDIQGDYKVVCVSDN